MIVIFNITGALVALLGLFVGVVVLLVTGSLGFGLLAAAGIWCWLGRSRPDKATGIRRPAPSIFFIPLLYWGILVAIVALPATVVEFTVGRDRVRQTAADPNAAQFARDEAGLRTNESDAPQLSSALVLLIANALPGEAVNVRVRFSVDSVLVLLKLRDLRKIRESDRETLLEAIRELAELHRPGVKTFVGVKGSLVYGAISTPTQPVLVGPSVPKEALYAFYKSAELPGQAAGEATGNSIPNEQPSSDGQVGSNG